MPNGPRWIFDIVEGIRNPVTRFFYHNSYGTVLNIVSQVFSIAVGYHFIVRKRTKHKLPTYLFIGIIIGTAIFMAYQLAYWDHIGNPMVPILYDFGALLLMAIPCIAVSAVPHIKTSYRIVLFTLYILGSLNYVFFFLFNRVFPINALVNWG